MSQFSARPFHDPFISVFRYVPRQGEGDGGRIKDYRIYVGDALVQK